MDTDCEIHLVGPIEERASAERLLDAVMLAMGHERAAKHASGGPVLCASILPQKNGHWLSVPEAAVRRLLREAPSLRVYRVFLENRIDDETHGGELARLELHGDPPRLAASIDEEIEEEDLVKGGVLPDVALYYLLGFMADHEDIGPPSDPPEWGTWVTYAPVRSSASPAVARAQRALADAVTHEATQTSGRWQIRMTLADGSRRILFLTDAEWSELQAELGR